MDKIQKLKKEKKIGIIIHSGSHLFSSGIIQNAYFIYQCFEHMGLKPEFLCYDKDPKPFGYKGLALKRLSLSKEEFDPSEYCLVMTVTRSTDEKIYKMFHDAKVAVCGFVCGNCVMFDQEDFVRGARGDQCTFIDYKSKTDEIWIIPSFWPSHYYLETIRRSVSHVVPHLWSPEIIKDWTPRVFNKPESALFYNKIKHTGKKLTILILESNMAVLKNAWIPLVACEKLHQEHPDLIDEIFVFNYPAEKYAWMMGDSLSLGKKIRRFARLSFPEIVLAFNEKDTIPIFLSYQLNNTLNYLYYEALYYGYPLVHNSPDLDKCGYFYPEFDLKKCADQMLDVYNSHNDNLEKYNTKSKKYLKRVDPLDKDVCKIWDERLDHILKKVNV